MGLFPIVDRELRVLARRRSLYRSRLAFAKLAIGVGAFFLLVYRGRYPAQISQQMFVTLANLTFVYAALAGVWLTSDCISEERRGDTLGLLFLTNLRGVDVVFGKMVASSLQSSYGVLAVFPVMAMTLLMGGIGLAEFWRVLLALLVTLLLSLSIGVALSSRSRIAARSGIGSFVVVLCCLILGGVVEVGLRMSGFAPSGAEQRLLMLHSPAYGLYLAYENSYAMRANHYWISIGINLLLSGLALSLASRWVQGGWQRTTSKVPGARVQIKSEGGRRSGGPVAFAGAPAGDGNPVCWSLLRNRWKSLRVYGVFVIVGIYGAWGALQAGPSFFNEGNFLFVGFMMQLVLKCWVGIEAASRFGGERRSGALELLLCTPLTVPGILRGHWQALVGQFFWPVFGVLCLELAMLVAGTSGRVLSDDTRYWIIVCLSGMVFFALDLVALSWLGMWRGLTARQGNRAIMSTILSVLGMPWLIFVLCLAVMTMNVTLIRQGPDEYFLLFLWWLVCGISSVSWFCLGWGRLHRQLQRVATVPVGETIPQHKLRE